jgi:hypothetical protein
MATKVTWVLVLSSVGVVGLSGWCMYTGPDRVDLSTAHGKAFQYLREGRYDEAMRTITAVEAAARANLNHRPGPAISILMTKAQIRSLQMNMEDSERFLSQLEKECVGTPAADWVRVAACSERAFGYRLMEDWPEPIGGLQNGELVVFLKNGRRTAIPMVFNERQQEVQFVGADAARIEHVAAQLFAEASKKVVNVSHLRNA